MLTQPIAARRLETRSFRDPAGYLFCDGKRILRRVRPESVTILEKFLQTKTALDASNRGRLVRSIRVDQEVFEHERIPFPSYPYEWSPEMLYSAASLTLELARNALEEGFGIKDATPYNVLFRGSAPVFVDVLSFEPRDPLECVWAPYGQFGRTFLLPLLVHDEFGVPLRSIFTNQRDGLEPEAVYRWAAGWRRFTPQFLTLVSIPHWLSGRVNESTYSPRAAQSSEQSRFILERILKTCNRHLESLAPKPRHSTWSDYRQKSLYNADQWAQKEAFVREAIAIAHPRDVLDVGANEGHFSFLAAQGGASVIAIDTDPAVAGAIWRSATENHLDILPLVVDLTRPSPAIGWRNRECVSFIDRARAAFDLVMLLAVLHHLLVTERIPLEEIFELLHEITREYALIEFVGPEDAMFRRIVRGRAHLYSHLTQSRFEAAALRWFELVKSAQINGLNRCLYLFRRRHAKS